MDMNRIVTYSLLAHINDHDKGIKDLNDIFLPLVKRVLFQLNKRGTTKGLLTELKSEVDKSYSFDIPFPILRKIITRVAAEANKEVANDFQFFRDGSFLMSKFIFADYEEIILKQQAEVDSLANTYEQYLLANDVNPSLQPSVFEFLDRNRITLSRFFSFAEPANLGPSFFMQAKFVNDIRNEPALYQIMRKIYLGSIITSYLELDFGEIKESQTEYLLDSSFIVHLLDLSSPESTHTCSKIIEICKRLKYKVSALDFTIDETGALLKRIADSLGTTFLIEQLDERSIYNACARRSFGRTDLLRIAMNLDTTLRDDYGIYIIPNTTSFRNKAKYSSEYELLKKRTNNPDGAWHDATAIVYVQEKRKKRSRSFYEANCWFVTDTKQDVVLTRKQDGTLPEMIRPEEIVNILWLTNPHVKGNEITDVGLTRLVAGTISDSLPNPRVLKEFDGNLQKYGQGKIEPADCIRLGHMIANKSLTNLERLNVTANESPSRFVEALSQYVERAKIAEQETQQNKRALILRLKANYETKLREKEGSLIAKFQEEVQQIQSAHSVETAEVKRRELVVLREALSQVENTHVSMSKSKLSLDKAASVDAHKILRRWVVLIGVIIIAQLVLTIKYGWNVMEPWTYFIGLVPVIGAYFYFAYTKKEASPKGIWDAILKSKKAKRYSNAGFDEEFFASLEPTIDAVREKIEARNEK